MSVGMVYDLSRNKQVTPHHEFSCHSEGCGARYGFVGDLSHPDCGPAVERWANELFASDHAHKRAHNPKFPAPAYLDLARYRTER
jgi:hypothetical protein